jgi:glycerophosphoryl diester phosphodiesterase
VAFLSFAREALLRCRRLAPEIPRGHLFYRASLPEVLEGAREAGTDLVLPEKGMLSDELSAALREAGLRLATWVVDDPAELPSLLRHGLFGVASNRPGVILEALEDWEDEEPGRR